MKRAIACLSPFTLLLMASTAGAQSRSWVPWGEIGAGPAPKAATAKPGPNKPGPAKPGPIRVAGVPYAAKPAVPAASSGSVFGQVPTPKPVSFPAQLQGGPRPSISPQAPGQVAFTGYGAGSIVIDTAGRSLYYVTSSASAYKYPISVGRDGFTWRGTQKVTSVQSWPDWRPPAEMRQRQPGLPEVMSGGVNNPLGAKALYLGSTLYRIHGTNDSKSIGYAASSGCFRMMNAHVMHLATVAGVGTTVHVLDSLPRNVASGAAKKSG
jgi:lipoprotein-anchoring transpeptidase ErfK/SrfK